MKKLFSVYTLMSLAIGLCIAVSSCAKDEDEPGNPSNPGGGGSTTTVKPQYVDLGLPSGIKWATFNVGATSPEEPGGYYAWGETFQKNEYNKETYTVAGITEDFSGDARYDVATAKWGDNWRTPKIEEITELIEECEWERGSLAGVNGWWVTGPNGNNIFLPQGGYYSDSYLASVGSWGKYWSSTPSSGSYSALMDMLGSFSPSKGYTARYSGYSVRPVYYEKAPAQPRESVDLGLSVEWATYNVGSEAPEDYGDFYAWGEIKTKTTYTEENCQTLDMEIADFAGNPLYDAAAYEWGGDWRMPTKEEVEELIYECEWKIVKRNSIPGYQVTGTNGNSIFLPFSGYMSDSNNSGRRYQCNFWTSTPQFGRAWNMNASESWSGSRGYISRHYGYSIRPVRPSSGNQRKPILYATPNEASL